MPVLATSAKGIINIMMEAAPGEQLLLATTPVIATITGLTAPTGSTGMRPHIRITGWTASGTLTITGTGTPNNTETVNIAAPPAQPLQSAQMGAYEYVSTNAYTAITNITTTGLTNGMITVYGIQAGKFQLPGILTSDRVVKDYSANEHNGFIERDKKIVHLVNMPVFDIKQDAYGDLSLYWPYMMMGAPTTTATIPAAPTVLLAPAAISATQSLTTQPTAPGQKLIFTVTSFTVAGTISINGTVNGIPNTTETITIGAAGTFYSSNVYSAVAASGITSASLAATVGITGVFGWSYTFLSSGNMYSAAIEWFDGVGSWTHPFCLAQEGDFDAKVQTEISLNVKGKSQDKLPIGDRTTTPLTGVNRIASLGANLTDTMMVGWQTAVYLDDITGTPLTTQNINIEELKISYKTPQEEHYTFTNSQNYNRAYSGKREYLIAATLDFTDQSLWEVFRQNLKKYLAFQFLGPIIGTSAGTQYAKSWTWTIPFRTDGKFQVTSDPNKGNVYAKASWRAEYDSGIGAACKLVVISTVPPTYAA